MHELAAQASRQAIAIDQEPGVFRQGQFFGERGTTHTHRIDRQRTLRGLVEQDTAEVDRQAV
jgi:hypothetical protein